MDMNGKQRVPIVSIVTAVLLVGMKEEKMDNSPRRVSSTLRVFYYIMLCEMPESDRCLMLGKHPFCH